ncbi:hypothetical protein NPIL_48471 [Nephila pilipes]|uniref:Uncharacterized protein n=1 Tax=Nephila pilipes TaxID=299642 RepID=A0A8X6KGR9_NEPPI|nr:hypothetical protein NPIL_48471 [Nephila pilipes]
MLEGRDNYGCGGDNGGYGGHGPPQIKWLGNGYGCRWSFIQCSGCSHSNEVDVSTPLHNFGMNRFHPISLKRSEDVMGNRTKTNIIWFETLFADAHPYLQ